MLDSNFISQFKSNAIDFTRQRCFSFKSLTLFILYSIQSSIQRELDRFFKVYNNKELSERFVSQSAFSQARLKVKPEVFEALNQECINHFYSFNPVKKWNGFRLIAIDGSELMLPKNEETIEKYGEYTSNFMKKKIVLSRLSKAFDVLNNITIDAKLVKRTIGEHTLANNHLKLLGKGDLLLFDRGYPSYDLFKNTLKKGCHFCARVAISNWKAAKKLIESGEKEIISEIKPGHGLASNYRRQGIVFQPIRLRFICIETSTEEKVVLVTSLLDSEEYPYEIFKELYHLRWFVEESYKIDKHRLQLENFSGKSNIAIQQDFLAKVLLGNITAILASNIKPKKHLKSLKKYKYRINSTTALAKVKESLALLFSHSQTSTALWIEKLYAILAENNLPVRPNRSFKRVQYKKRRYYRTYLSL